MLQSIGINSPNNSASLKIDQGIFTLDESLLTKESSFRFGHLAAQEQTLKNVRFLFKDEHFSTKLFTFC